MFAVFVACGQTLVSVGISTKSFMLIIIGRTVFGLGGESVSVAQSAITARWFKGAELATAFGIALSFSRVGSAANFDISPSVAGNICTNSVVDMCGVASSVYNPVPVSYFCLRYTNAQCSGDASLKQWKNHIGDCDPYPYPSPPSSFTSSSSYATAFNCNSTFVEFSLYPDTSCASNNTLNVSFILDSCQPAPGYPNGTM